MDETPICAICEEPILGEKPWTMGHPDAPEDERFLIHGECMGITDDMLRESEASSDAANSS